MRHRVSFIVLLVMLGVGCDRPQPEAPPPPQGSAPSGNARYTDADGRDRTAFRPVGAIGYGERVEDVLAPAEALVGYEFAGGGGDVVQLTLEVEGAATASMAVYGPRAANGLWDRPLAAAERVGVGVLRLPPVELPGDGYYFVLLRRMAGERAGFGLSLVCTDCPAPMCEGVEPCDLFCEAGYASDEAGCRQCGCEDRGCVDDDDCLGGEVCGDGQCRAAPACDERCRDAASGPEAVVCGADGNSHPNACVAACRGIEVVARGFCDAGGCEGDDECADGQRCVGGECVCDCPDARVLVCGVSGTEYLNRCVLECEGDELAYAGPCGRVAPLRPCGEGGRCGDGQICVGGDEGGVCASSCPLGDGPEFDRICGLRAVCADVGAERGVCLPACDRERFCPEGLSCGVDGQGRPACLPCGCEGAEGGPVCVGGRLEFESACEATCAGFGPNETAPGACEAPSRCDRCDDMWMPVCADGVLFSSGCDAMCDADRRLERPDTCFERSPVVPCRTDEQCGAEVCAGWACGAGEGRDGCPTLDAGAQCFVDYGECGCVAGMCGFRPVPGDAQIVECLDAARND